MLRALDTVGAVGSGASTGGAGDPDADNGEILYDWNIATDEIAWGPGFQTVPGLPDVRSVSTGVDYAEHLAAESPSSRFEVIMTAGGVDSGGGVPYTAIYGLVPGRRSGAAPVWVEDIGRWFADANDRPCRAHGVVRVITKRYEAERSAQASIQRDALTGAFTRTYFIERMTRQLGSTSRKPSHFAVLLIGLDSQGSTDPLADAQVARVAGAIRAEMRAHEMLARFGADTFAALLESCNDNQAAAAADRLMDAVASAGSDDGAPGVRARIGMVLAPHHGRTPQALMRFAEEALDAARMPTGTPIVRFDPRLSRPSPRPAEASREILEALSDDRVVLAMQPIVEAKSRSVALHEGLVRIRRPDGSLMMPDALVPNAEKNGLVAAIDCRVLDLAFAHLCSAGELNLSINASVTSLGDVRWLDHLRSSCRLRPAAARRLVVEITETCAIADMEATRRTLTAIKALGVRIALDDFGSGHSSFRNLRNLPIDYLKIDGAFAQNLASSPDDRFFIRTLIDLARNLHVPTIAEWVEDEGTAGILTDWGIGYMQGHLFGKAEIWPVPVVARAGRSRR